MQFDQILKRAYHANTSPRIEDLVFWEYLKYMKNIYNVIVKIPVGKIGYSNFLQGLLLLESRGEPYDLIILNHGVPNHLTTGFGGYFFSYRELEGLKGKLPNLNLVMLQGCYGRSLALDFKQAGAKYVLSYSESNDNYFFFGSFLKYYYPGVSVRYSYNLARENFDFFMNGFPYNLIVDELLTQEGFVNYLNVKTGFKKISKDVFIKSLAAPLLD